MDEERRTEHPEDYEDIEPIYEEKLIISPLVSDFGGHYGHVRIILCLWKYGTTNQADLARRTKISGPQVHSYTLKLKEAGIIISQKSIANKKRVLYSINETFRERNPTFPNDVYGYWHGYVSHEIIESIKVKRWYTLEDLRANQVLRRIMKRNNFKWKDVMKILNSDDFYRSEQRVARKYGSYGQLIEKDEIKTKKKTTKELLEEAEKHLEVVEDEQ